MAVATLVVMAVTGRLGLWQLDRAAQKIAWRDAQLAQAQAPVLAPSELARTEAQAQAQQHRRVRVQGRWLPAHTVFLDNRQMDGRPGFFVVTPLQLAPGDVVLVQRGWVPRDAQERTRLPEVASPAGLVTLTGHVDGWPSRLAQLGGEVPGPIRQNLEPAAFARELGQPLRPLSIRQDEAAPEGDAELRRQWPAVADRVATHYGYAVQWFSLCALAGGLYVWFQLIRPRRARRLAD